MSLIFLVRLYTNKLAAPDTDWATPYPLVATNPWAMTHSELAPSPTTPHHLLSYGSPCKMDMPKHRNFTTPNQHLAKSHRNLTTPLKVFIDFVNRFEISIHTVVLIPKKYFILALFETLKLPSQHCTSDNFFLHLQICEWHQVVFKSRYLILWKHTSVNAMRWKVRRKCHYFEYPWQCTFAIIFVGIG